MNRKQTIKTFLLAGTLLGSIPAQAQTFESDTFVNITPSFFMAVLAGVLLALGFQFLLTTLSVASGISVASIDSSKSSSSNSSSSSSSTSDTVKKAIAGAGIWSIITASISIFFATLLAVRLGMVAGNIIGVTLGLVIWSAFMAITIYFEWKAGSSFAGGLASTAFSGIRNLFSGIRGTMKTSEDQKLQQSIEHAADYTTDRIKYDLAKNFDFDFDTDAVRQQLNKWVTDLKPEPLDYDRLREEMEELITDLEVEEKEYVKHHGLDHKIFFKLASEQPRFSGEDAKQISTVARQVIQARKQADSPAEQVENIVTSFTSATGSDIDRYKRNLEEYLRSTGKEELQPENLRRDINRIFSEPKQAGPVGSAKMEAIDRDTFVNVLSSREDISEKEANRIADFGEQVLDRIQQSIPSGDGGPSAPDMPKIDVKGKSQDIEGKLKQKLNEATVRIENRIRDYFNRTDRPELQYQPLKWDLQKIFNDPKATPEVLKNRFNQFDRETLLALLANNKHVSRQQAEKLVNNIENTKSEAINRTRELQEKAKIKAAEMKQEALKKADDTRKVAAAAAWWLFLTILVSGVAAAIGGAIAV